MSISSIPKAGRGIFAGKHFNPNEFIDRDPTLIIHKEDCHGNQMEDYLFLTYDPQYTLLVFGTSTLYNSHLNKSVDYTPDNQQAKFKPRPNMALVLSTRPYTTYTDMLLYTARSVEEGEELYEYYGDEWHQARGLPAIGEIATNMMGDVEEVETRSESDTTTTVTTTATIKQPEKSSKYHKVCLSDVYINESTVFEAGRGLFASRDFATGELVTMSPMIALSRSFVDKTSFRSYLKNYAFVNGKSKVVLVPLMKVAMINHQPPPEDNVEMKWFSWNKKQPKTTSMESTNVVDDNDDDDMTQKALKLSVEDLLASRSVLFDIGFYAKKPIKKDEEIFLDYGMTWEEAWGDAACHMYDQTGCGCISRFRSYIEVPDGLFPNHWY